MDIGRAVHKQRQAARTLPSLNQINTATAVTTMSDTSSILLPEQLPECTKVHWMPFGIAYDGPISTSAQYFEPVVQQRGDHSVTALLAASLRPGLCLCCKHLCNNIICIPTQPSLSLPRRWIKQQQHQPAVGGSLQGSSADRCAALSANIWLAVFQPES